MAKTSILSTSIDASLKKAVNAVSKQKGMKIRSFIEHALREQLEDYFDGGIYEKRRNEEVVAASEVKAYFKKLRSA